MNIVRTAVIVVTGLCISVSHAAWPGSTAVNVPISLAAGDQVDVFACSDGVGGAIFAWVDNRSGDKDIYAQRIDVDGNTLWDPNGVPVCTQPQDQQFSLAVGNDRTPITSDGTGGAIIVWHDWRDANSAPDVYAQRIDPNGNPLWSVDGELVASSPEEDKNAVVVEDGAGGVIVAFSSDRLNVGEFDVWADRIGPDGISVWGGDVLVCDATLDQDFPRIASDGASGAVIVWEDDRDSGGTAIDIYAQRVDLAGNALWANNGESVVVTTEDQDSVVIDGDGAGGAFIAWDDDRGGDTNVDIYAQYLGSDGSAMWAANGTRACGATNSQYRPDIVADGEGGAVVSWHDFRNELGGVPPYAIDIFAQRLDPNGAAIWLTNGNSVCGAIDAQRNAVLATDGEGQFYIAWEDERNGEDSDNIYGQVLALDGHARLAVDGQPVSTASGQQGYPILVCDGDGGAIAAFEDDRNGTDEDLYADRFAAPRKGDCDGDDDVDLTDFLYFQTCFTGPGGGPVGEECECSDFNLDGDVDLLDFLAFQAAYTGPPDCGT